MSNEALVLMKSPHQKILTRTRLILVTLFLAALEAYSAGFQAAGTLTGEVVMPDGSRVTRQSLFTVTVAGCDWKIQTEQINDPLSQFDLRVEAGSTNNGRVFAVSYARDQGQAEWKPIAGNIRPGPVPHLLPAPTVTILWLAYASECYFQDRRTNGIPLLVHSDPSLHNISYTVPLHVTLSDARPHLPVRAVYFEDGLRRYWKTGVPPWSSPPIEEPVLAPYDKGYTNLVFQKLETTNASDFAVPTLFELIRYRTRDNARIASDLDVHSLFRGTVTNVHAITEVPLLIPQLPPAIPIADERFIKDAIPVWTISYDLDDQETQWLSDKDVKKLPEYKQQIALQQMLQQARPVVQPGFDRTNVDNRVSGKPAARITWWMIVTVSVTLVLLWVLVKKVTKQT